jgi:FMN phosphatase YigB (HAD superfamily)
MGMKINNVFCKIYLFLLLISMDLYPRVLVWDLGFTLFEPSKYQAAKAIGFYNSVLFWLKHRGASQDLIRTALGDVLHSHGNHCHFESHAPRDPKGYPISALNISWFEGTRNSTVLRSEVRRLIDYHDGFLDSLHKQVVTNTFAWMYNPKLYAQSWIVIPEALELLEKCAQQTDSSGKSKHTLYVLSNFDEETFKYLYENPVNAAVFKHFPRDHIFVSAHMKDIKPRASVFIKMLTACKIDPRDAIFIDDQLENCITAYNLGIHAVHIKKNSFDAVRDELISLGIIAN